MKLLSHLAQYVLDAPIIANSIGKVNCNAGDDT